MMMIILVFDSTIKILPLLSIYNDNGVYNDDVDGDNDDHNDDDDGDDDDDDDNNDHNNDDDDDNCSL
jgi:hypothetical protein